MRSQNRAPGPFVSPFPLPMVPAPDDTTWEYRRIERNVRTGDPPTEQELNALGSEGWELVGMFFDSPLLYLYLKRLA